jgi:hypothetical protein
MDAGDPIIQCSSNVENRKYIDNARKDFVSDPPSISFFHVKELALQKCTRKVCGFIVA